MVPVILPNFTINALETRDMVVCIDAHSTSTTATCPDCQSRAGRIHSRYLRSPRDLPVSAFCVQLRLHMRRFFCDNPACSRRTFCERLPDFLPFHAQRTSRLTQALQTFGAALGGRAGARIAQDLRFPTSRSTVGRVLHHAAVPAYETPRVLGVDDFAFRRGRRYGTILVDLERHRVVDLLPDRTAATLETWLRAHPGIEIVTRDRSVEYRRGITAGAPTAMQIADRWHLVANLRESVERVFDRVHSRLRRLVAQQLVTRRTVPSTTAIPVRTRRRSPHEEAARVARRDRRYAQYEAVRLRVAQGMSFRQIALDLHMSRWLVHRLAQGDGFPERAPARMRGSILQSYESQLQALWQGGERNTMAFYRALQTRGYRGSIQTVRRWVQHRRLAPAPRTKPQYRATYRVAPHEMAERHARLARIPSARQLSWLLLRDSTTLDEDEQTLLAALRHDAMIATTDTLAQHFLAMVRHQQEDQLDAWMSACQDSGITALQNFVAGLRHDEAAVRAALSSQWSNGQTEGQVNRLKLVKRQMYGRGSFELLRRRVLATAGDHGT